jgi:5'-deoxynucleotidase YfbR-like HD superfamily hydrolase
MSWIQTASGKKLDYLAPTASAISIDDIATCLSRLARFGGHTTKFYSVAQHSVIVSRYVAERGGDRFEQLVGLLHDAPEAYVMDLPRPLKLDIGGEYQRIESRLWHVIAAKFLRGCCIQITRLVKDCDTLAMVTEARDLFAYQPIDDWTAKYAEPDPRVIVPVSMRQARAMYLHRFHELAYTIGHPASSIEHPGS